MGKLRDLLLTEGNFPLADYKDPSYKSQAKSVKVPDDIYRQGQTENEVRKEVHAYLKKEGWIATTMYTGGIPTGHGLASNPAKGFPDIIALHPVKRCIIFIELKKNKGGTLSPEQQTWHTDLRRCKQKVYVVTSVDLLKQLLEEGT